MNAIEGLFGDREGKMVFRLRLAQNVSLVSGAGWLNLKIGWYRRKPIHDPESILGLLEQKDGIFLVFHFGKDYRFGIYNNHVICVDADKDEIMDCAERYMMSFSQRSI